MENGEEYYVPNKDFAAVAPGDGSQVIVFRAEGIGFNVLEIDTIDSIRPGLEESRKSQDPFLLNSP